MKSNDEIIRQMLRAKMGRYTAGQKRAPTGESSRDRPSRGLPKRRPVTLAKVTALSDEDFAA